MSQDVPSAFCYNAVLPRCLIKVLKLLVSSNAPRCYVRLLYLNGVHLLGKDTVVFIFGLFVHLNGSPVRLNGSSVRLNGSPVHLNGSPVRLNGCSVHLNGSLVRLNGCSVRLNGSLVQVNISCELVKLKGISSMKRALKLGDLFATNEWVFGKVLDKNVPSADGQLLNSYSIA